jgi:V8-like Glu-specific endopeptidase
MKFTITLILLSFVSAKSSGFEVSSLEPEIIYGEDNRVDTFESSSSLFKELAQSTAAQIPKYNMKFLGPTIKLLGPPIREVFRLCKKERFAHQPFVASCSGFLVAPDIIATAGHCMQSREDCTQNHWVFNYRVENSNQRSVSVRSSDVYNCKEVIKQEVSGTHDFSLIRLDRPVQGVLPVKIAKNLPKTGDPVVMIGYPSGLPQKISDNAIVTSVSKNEFRATVDAFQINSGSAIFHSESGELMGILIRGQRDYRTNEELGCTEVNTTENYELGEDIASFTQFIEYIK